MGGQVIGKSLLLPLTGFQTILELLNLIGDCGSIGRKVLDVQGYGFHLMVFIHNEGFQLLQVFNLPGFRVLESQNFPVNLVQVHTFSSCRNFLTSMSRLIARSAFAVCEEARIFMAIPIFSAISWAGVVILEPQA